MEIENWFWVSELLLFGFWVLSYGIHDMRKSKYLGKGHFSTGVEEPIKNPFEFFRLMFRS